MYSLSDFGSFYLGGRIVEVKGKPPETVRRNKDMQITVDPNGHYLIEAIYVQYFIPESCKDIYLLIHGGGHTGAIWENTPDGRKNWLHFFLERNIGVYIVDTVERGRSGWCTFQEFWPDAPESRSQEITWEAFRLGMKDNFNQKIPFSKNKFPINSFETLTKYNVPRWDTHTQNSVEAVNQLIAKIGKKCSIVAHSQGAGVALECLNKNTDALKNIILLEPAAFPSLISNNRNNKIKILMLFGDFIEYSPLWADLYQKALEYSRELKLKGYDCEFISLPELGIRGNSHVMMMDKNNKEIFELTMQKVGLCLNN